MTPPETPDRKGTGTTGDDDRRGGAATSTSTDVRPAEPEDLALTTVNPPPWQRVTQDEQQDLAERDAEDATEATTETSAAAPDETTAERQPVTGHPVTAGSFAGEDSATVQRPVVTGSAAARLFGQPDSGQQQGDLGDLGEQATRQLRPVDPAQERTSVRIGGASSAVRPAGGTPPSALRRPGRGPRRANLQIKRFDPWSVLKLSLVFGIALFFVWLVAVGVLYAVLDGMGVWDKINSTTTEFFQTGGDNGTAEPLISAGRVFGIAAVIGAINIVLFSALTTVGAFIYNVSADLAGGIEVTLAERE